MPSASSLEKQLATIIKNGLKNAMPRSKTRNRRNGNGMPLTAWMAGVNKQEPSKIFAVCEGRVRYPYIHVGYGARALGDRIAQRYGVTSIQHDLILEHLLRHYRGSNRVPEWNNGCQELREFSKNLSRKTFHIFENVCCKLNTLSTTLPLNVLIDDRVTNLLMLIEMEEQLKLSKQRK